MRIVIAVAVGYLLGSIPFALLLTRSRGDDLRHVGSRNVGAANVLRTSGVARAIAVMLLDAAKVAMAGVVARLPSISCDGLNSVGVALILTSVTPACSA